MIFKFAFHHSLHTWEFALILDKLLILLYCAKMKNILRNLLLKIFNTTDVIIPRSSIYLFNNSVHDFFTVSYYSASTTADAV